MRKSGCTDLRIIFLPLKGVLWKEKQFKSLMAIVSMILQALYNVVDSVFVTNMQGIGALANEALTIAFPVQIMIIAIGVGTGVGLNAMLSISLNKNDKQTVNAVVSNGIFLSVFITLCFYFSDWFC